MSRIVEHPDVQRQLLTMKALTAAARAICHVCAHAIDMSRRGPPEARAGWADRAGLLTPIAKAFSTDIGIAVASLGIQVHGGTGYIEETGAAQYLRDARVFAIYEGTNGIQAIDLVSRKLALDGGETVRRLIAELAAVARDAAALNRDAAGRLGILLDEACRHLTAATDYLLAALAEKRRKDALAGATAYLRLFALTAGCALLTKGALAADEADKGDAWLALARFFAETRLGETAGLSANVQTGGAGLVAAATLHLGMSNG